jgi:hypothetical protein
VDQPRVALVLAAIGTVLMAVHAGAAMLLSELYRDEAFALDAWRVNDPVTLFAAVSLALASLALAWCGSLRALLVLLGTMPYALYNYRLLPVRRGAQRALRALRLVADPDSARGVCSAARSAGDAGRAFHVWLSERSFSPAAG